MKATRSSDFWQRSGLQGVRFRIFCGTGLLVLLGLGIAAFSWRALGTVSRRVNNLSQQAEESVTIQRVDRTLDTVARAALVYRLTGDEQMARSGEAADLAAESGIKQLAGASGNETQRTIYATVLGRIGNFRQSRNVLQIMGGQLDELRSDIEAAAAKAAKRAAMLTQAAIESGDVALIAKAITVEQAVQQMHVASWRFIATIAPADRAAFQKQAEHAAAVMNVLQEAELPDEIAGPTAQLGLGLGIYATAFDQFSALLIRQKAQFDEQIAPQLAALQVDMHAAADAQRQQTEQARQDTSEVIEQTSMLQRILAASALVVGVLVAAVAGRSILRPVAKMTDAMTGLAAGNTAITLPRWRALDEIGQMAAALEVFRTQGIHNKQMAIDQEEEHVKSTAEKLAALTNMADLVEAETSRGLAEVIQRSEAMATTVESMNSSALRVGASALGAGAAAALAQANAQTVTFSAEQLSASVREISSQIGLSGKVVERAVSASQETRCKIDELNEKVTKIAVVTEIISSIATQTNLLALNATIEAARAGDAGKGFAVVAGEVKALATQTASATHDIARYLAELKAATLISVTSVGQIEDTIAEINAISGTIATAIGQQGEATAKIAHNVAQAGHAADEMACRVSELTHEADQSVREASEVQRNIKGLGVAVATLKRTVVRVMRTSTKGVGHLESVG